MPAPKGTRPPNAGKGRPKGSQNVVTTQVKELILRALDGAGGLDYLIEQAHANPVAFLGLVGKVLPLQVHAEHKGTMVAEVIFRGLNDG